MTTPKTFAIEIIRLLSNIQPVSKLEYFAGCLKVKTSGNTEILGNPDFQDLSKSLGNPDYVEKFRFSRSFGILKF